VKNTFSEGMEANDAEEPQLSVRNRRRSRRAQREQKRKRKRKQRSNYNSEFGESAEFASLCWDDWSKYPRLTLGSQDSLDLDVVYIFPKRPSVTQCYNFCDPPVDKSTGRWKEPVRALALIVEVLIFTVGREPSLREGGE